MPRRHFPLPRRRRWRVALALGGALLLYLVALSAIPAIVGTRAGAQHGRGVRAIQASNWGLVVPEDRAALSAGVDAAWRSLRTYQMRYVTGTPAALDAGQPESEATSVFRLRADGKIAEQHDTSVITAASPASGGRDERLEGFRILTDRPFVNRRGQQVGKEELVYRRAEPGIWVCERVLSDSGPPPPPGLDLSGAGDAGFAEIDGRPVRGFTLARGAFGLRTEATIWIETDTLRVRRQEIASSIQGRREVWTYHAFNDPVTITPPAGVTCQET